MVINNTLFIRIIFSPFFAYIVGILLCFTFKSLDSYCLCQEETLNQLMADLLEQTNKYTVVVKDYCHYTNILEIIADKVDKDLFEEERLVCEKHEKFKEMNCLLNKINTLQLNIKQLNPNFKIDFNEITKKI